MHCLFFCLLSSHAKEINLTCKYNHLDRSACYSISRYTICYKNLIPLYNALSFLDCEMTLSILTVLVFLGVFWCFLIIWFDFRNHNWQIMLAIISLIWLLLATISQHKSQTLGVFWCFFSIIWFDFRNHNWQIMLAIISLIWLSLATISQHKSQTLRVFWCFFNNLVWLQKP